MDLSFSGAGFMGCYYFGVVNCWNKYIPRERVRRVAGASAGSLIAAYYLMDLPLDPCLYEIINLLDSIRKRPLGVFDRKHQIVDILPKLLDKVLPDDAHKRVNGRLFVSMTRLKDMKNIIVNQFETKQELIDALNCSSFIPVWSGNHVSTFRGVKHIDGGFTNNLPVFDEHTIRICCFSGTSDIAPTDKARLELLSGQLQGMPFYLNWANMRRAGRALWPPPATYVISLLERGFHDAKDFILTNDLIQCEKCYRLTAPDEHPIFGKLTPTISPAMSRAVSFNDLSALGTEESYGRGGEEGKLISSSTAEIASKPATTKSKGLKLKLPGVGGKRMASPTSDINESSESSNEENVSSAPKSKDKASKNKKRLNSQSSDESSSSWNGLERTKSESSSFASMLSDKLKRVASLQQSETNSDGKNRKAGTSLVDKNNNNKRSGSPEDGAAISATTELPMIIVEDHCTDSGLDDESTMSEPQQRHQVRSKLIILPEQQESTAKEQSSSSDEDEESSGESTSAAEPHRTAARSKQEEKSRRKKEDKERIKLGKLSNRRQSLAAVPTGSSPSEKFIANSRRNTQAQIDISSASFLMADKFSSVAEVLPSCPPSPNLNRRCAECIRMRQEARIDAVDEAILEQAEKYLTPKAKVLEMKEAGIRRSKITSPIKWVRQKIGKKSYKFPQSEQDRSQVAIQQTVAY